MASIGIFFIVVGILLIYIGTKLKMSSKKISDSSFGEGGVQMFKGYLKIMTIIGGVAFLMIGLMWSCIGAI